MVVLFAAQRGVPVRAGILHISRLQGVSAGRLTAFLMQLERRKIPALTGTLWGFTCENVLLLPALLNGT